VSNRYENLDGSAVDGEARAIQVRRQADVLLCQLADLDVAAEPGRRQRYRGRRDGGAVRGESRGCDESRAERGNGQ
jgi:hypothetical protein